MQRKSVWHLGRKMALTVNNYSWFWKERIYCWSNRNLFQLKYFICLLFSSGTCFNFGEWNASQWQHTWRWSKCKGHSWNSHGIPTNAEIYTTQNDNKWENLLSVHVLSTVCNRQSIESRTEKLWHWDTWSRHIQIAVFSNTYRYFVYDEPVSIKKYILSVFLFLSHCVGVKFMVVSETTQTGVDVLLKRIYELYADYVLKNPFYSLEMPIRCELFDTNLQALLEQMEKGGVTNI